MPGKIQLLTDEVIGKIAAGEVVERPAAAIKELVENSLDAGATAVTVEIRDGGVSYFRVTDNGSGIRASDIRMAFERHATNKIRQAQDLYSISTLGFRGEALASIAAVAHVTCTTRTKDYENGLKVQNNGGVIVSMDTAACPEGTTFVVRDLFFNTPVRLKFLKKPVTEAGMVSDLMMRLILSRPDVSFRYVSQGKTLYHSAGDGKLSSAVFSIYGRELLKSMREVDGCQSGVVVKGYVGVGDSGRSNRSHQSFFINGRYMKANLLSSAVEEACRERVMGGKYPTCVLHLTMPYDQVDVNVHPNKLEVRFQNEPGVYAAVENAVRAALAEPHALDQPDLFHLTPEPAAQSPVTVVRSEKIEVEQKKPTVGMKTPDAPCEPPPAVAHAVPQQSEGPTADDELDRPLTLRQSSSAVAELLREADVHIPTVWKLPPTDAQTRPGSAPEVESPFPQPVPVPQKAEKLPHPQPSRAKTDQQPSVKAEQVPSFLPDAPKPLRLLGTVFRAYIVVEYENNLLLIDQHAVHERLLFDRMMRALDTQQCGQELLLPLLVPVTRREQALLQEHRALLESIGLILEPFGDTEVSIRSIPMILGQPQAKELLREVLDQLESERGYISLEKRRASILALACDKAVKDGDKLSESDIRDLVTRMVEQHVTPTSPRGAPLVVAIPRSDLDRRFRRG